MDQKTIIITGASSGIGEAAARTLAQTGDRIVIIGRSPKRTQAVAEDIGAEHFVADFSSLDQVRELAITLKKSYPRIDLLANNAGSIMGRRELTQDGYESTFQVNHLAPYLLTRTLENVLLASKAKVISTSSVAHRLFGQLDLNDLSSTKKYSSNLAYGNAKLANILFTKELHRRFTAEGLNAAAFHPGGVATNFSAGSKSYLRFLYGSGLRTYMLTPAQGAHTLVWLALGEPGIDWFSGGYYARSRPARISRQANDPDVAQQLWQRSEEMVEPWLP
ncbi:MULTISPECIES: SDR family NAD(P)-dependent oxidoreductase [Arthrobacter]|uniref:SDR family NAD(P)-dependent oxidoreductase n=1 Tax=unclassified Arthrobacter TaxID=235627 RepID=UPI0024B9700B|nr:SDR family NAD(P)-dependent oxidoreductase [Arthrobacter sp. H35-MC1]MDJ0315604.1 SDR family NAD(P)-dependent oxidoreductase [Arthrobacter sp. H35-MC1]